jgi:DtxR family Mn-dependent transcriptional regulator
VQFNLSIAEENHIKGIYHLQQKTKQVTTNELAAMLQTRPSSVTDMVKRLHEKKLLHYEAYQGFNLTAEGKKVAVSIIRKHRLWEFFLVEKLAFGWNEVHEIAEQLEHVSSKKLVDKLDAFLGHPKYDPHGDPIPDVNGRMPVIQQIKLIDMPLHTHATVTSVGNQSTDLLELLNHKNIQIGTRLEVKKKFSFDDSIEIKIKNQSITISNQLAGALFVKPL